MKIRDVVFYVNDINQSKDFYIRLGFEIEKEFGKFVSFKTADENIWFSINLADDPSKYPGKQTCVFWSEDIKNDFERIKKFGAKFVKELYQTPYGFTFSFRDIDGNKIEFVEKQTDREF